MPVFTAALVATTQIAGAAEPKYETVESILGDMTTLNKSVKNLFAEQNTLAVSVATLIGQNNLWNKQLTERLKPLVDAQFAKLMLHVANGKRLAGNIDRHNGACSGTKANAAYDRCKFQEGVLKEKSRAHYAEKNSLTKEMAALTKEQQVYFDRVKANTVKAKEYLKKSSAIGRKLAQHTKTLESYRTRLIDLCTKSEANGDGESLHLCHAVSWDGRLKYLPTLGEILRGTRFLK